MGAGDARGAREREPLPLNAWGPEFSLHVSREHSWGGRRRSRQPGLDQACKEAGAAPSHSPGWVRQLRGHCHPRRGSGRATTRSLGQPRRLGTTGLRRPSSAAQPHRGRGGLAGDSWAHAAGGRGDRCHSQSPVGKRAAVLQAPRRQPSRGGGAGAHSRRRRCGGPAEPRVGECAHVHVDRARVRLSPRRGHEAGLAAHARSPGPPSPSSRKWDRSSPAPTCSGLARSQPPAPQEPTWVLRRGDPSPGPAPWAGPTPASWGCKEVGRGLCPRPPT